MSELSTRMTATALRIIEARGAPMVLERTPSGSMNAAGDRTSTPDDTPFKGVFFVDGGEEEVDGLRVKVARILMAPVQPAPRSSQVVAVPPPHANAGRYTIRRAKNHGPEGAHIYSEVLVS